MEDRCKICQATATHVIKIDVAIDGKGEIPLCDYCYGYKMGRQHTTQKPKTAAA